MRNDDVMFITISARDYSSGGFWVPSLRQTCLWSPTTMGFIGFPLETKLSLSLSLSLSPFYSREKVTQNNREAT